MVQYVWRVIIKSELIMCTFTDLVILVLGELSKENELGILFIIFDNSELLMSKMWQLTKKELDILADSNIEMYPVNR